MLRLAGLLLLLGVLSACSAPQTRALQAEWPTAVAEQRLLDDVPFYPQELYQCGPAALATVLQQAGFPATPEALVDEVYLPSRQGSLQLEMLAAARDRGALTYPLRRDMQALIAEIDAGNPVLVLQNLALDWYPVWHYAVVVGYDRERSELILRSGTERERRTDFSVFERTWARGDYWAQLVLAPDELPATAELQSYLHAVLDAERVGRSHLPAWRAASAHWPNEPLSWLALGNAEYRAGRLAEAAHSYQRATEVDPGAVLAWNNYASVLGEMGCVGAANAALSCALVLEPQDARLLATQEELASMRTRSEASCPNVLACAR